MGILLSPTYVNTTVWLQHLESNKTLEIKARWELHKNVACHFKQISEPTFYKAAVVWLLTSHLINHPSNSRIMLGTAEEAGTSDVFPVDSYSWTHLC